MNIDVAVRVRKFHLTKRKTLQRVFFSKSRKNIWRNWAIWVILLMASHDDIVHVQTQYESWNSWSICKAGCQSRVLQKKSTFFTKRGIFLYFWWDLHPKPHNFIGGHDKLITKTYSNIAGNQNCKIYKARQKNAFFNFFAHFLIILADTRMVFSNHVPLDPKPSHIWYVVCVWFLKMAGLIF